MQFSSNTIFKICYFLTFARIFTLCSFMKFTAKWLNYTRIITIYRLMAIFLTPIAPCGCYVVLIHHVNNVAECNCLIFFIGKFRRGPCKNISILTRKFKTSLPEQNCLMNRYLHINLHRCRAATRHFFARIAR